MNVQDLLRLQSVRQAGTTLHIHWTSVSHSNFLTPVLFLRVGDVLSYVSVSGGH